MKKVSLLIFIILSLTSCTFTPKAMEGEENKQEVNKDLVCTQRLEILPISINGVMPPKESFDYSMNIIKKYTSKNIVVHPTFNVSIPERSIDSFLSQLGNRNSVAFLSPESRQQLEAKLAKLPRAKNAIVMVYTPTLTCPKNGKSQLRGLAYQKDRRFNVVAYNATTINKAPVISDVQAWKIVLTHEIGHRLGVPASVTHNKAGHCNNRECVMYASPDWQAVLSVLFHGMPYDFCDDCKLELKYAKESCGTPVTVYHSDPYRPYPSAIVSPSTDYENYKEK